MRCNCCFRCSGLLVILAGRMHIFSARSAGQAYSSPAANRIAPASDFSHAFLADEGEFNCTGCHNPHGPLSSDRCLICHPRIPETLANESEKARRFHEVAERKGTECMRCHKGIAHPIPPLVLQQSQEAMERLLEQ